jgi:hypothetical protein
VKYDQESKIIKGTSGHNATQKVKVQYIIPVQHAIMSTIKLISCEIDKC